MAMKYTRQLIEKAQERKCDICYQGITAAEAEKNEFEYPKTKRKNEVFVHKKCWRRLYG